MSYCAQSDLVLMFGESNINKWADADNDGDSGTIDARIAWACQFATDRVDNRLRGTRYAIPFSSAPNIVVQIATMLAGVCLYQTPRGLIDGDDEQDVFTALEERAEKMLDRIVNGQDKLAQNETIENRIGVA